MGDTLDFQMLICMFWFQQRPDGPDCTRKGVGGCARGFSAERFEPPLAGGSRCIVRASVLCWRAACAAWGEPARPGFPPEGGTGKGASQFPCCHYGPKAHEF